MILKLLDSENVALFVQQNPKCPHFSWMFGNFSNSTKHSAAIKKKCQSKLKLQSKLTLTLFVRRDFGLLMQRLPNLLRFSTIFCINFKIRVWKLSSTMRTVCWVFFQKVVNFNQKRIWSCYHYENVTFFLNFVGFCKSKSETRSLGLNKLSRFFQI